MLKIRTIQSIGRILLYFSGFSFGAFIALGGAGLPQYAILILSFIMPMICTTVFGVMTSYGMGKHA